MRGRPPLPTALKELRGTARRDRTNEREPRPEVLTKLPRPPKELDAYGRRHWYRLGRLLIRMGVLTEADLITFRLLCMYLGQIDEILEIMRELRPAQRYVLRSDKGGHYLNPLHNALRAVAKDAVQLLAKFGFSPADRTRIMAASEEEDLAELFGFSEN